MATAEQMPPQQAMAGGPARKETVASWSTSKLTRTLRMVNMCNGLLLITVGILNFFTGIVAVTFTTITVSAYVVFFGLMMTCLECNLSFLAPRIQRNFGFMFSFVGRTLFILFCGTMACAIGYWLGYIMGTFTFLNGLFNGYVILVHPAFRSGELSAKGDPYGGYSGGETEMADFLKRNPQLATKAIAFSAANPGIATAALAATAAPAAAAGGAGAAAAPNPWQGGAST